MRIRRSVHEQRLAGLRIATREAAASWSDATRCIASGMRSEGQPGNCVTHSPVAHCRRAGSPALASVTSLNQNQSQLAP
jgi:hypothetical protein